MSQFEHLAAIAGIALESTYALASASGCGSCPLHAYLDTFSGSDCDVLDGSLSLQSYDVGAVKPCRWIGHQSLCSVL